MNPARTWILSPYEGQSSFLWKLLMTENGEAGEPADVNQSVAIREDE
jgi:hypothetical protein